MIPLFLENLSSTKPRCHIPQVNEKHQTPTASDTRQSYSIISILIPSTYVSQLARSLASIAYARTPSPQQYRNQRIRFLLETMTSCKVQSTLELVHHFVLECVWRRVVKCSCSVIPFRQVLACLLIWTNFRAFWLNFCFFTGSPWIIA